MPWLGVGLVYLLLSFSSSLHFPSRVGLEEAVLQERPRSPHRWHHRDVEGPTGLAFSAPQVNTELTVGSLCEAGMQMLTLRGADGSP